MCCTISAKICIECDKMVSEHLLKRLTSPTLGTTTVTYNEQRTMHTVCHAFLNMPVDVWAAYDIPTESKLLPVAQR